jgi:hypothetical protein
MTGGDVRSLAASPHSPRFPQLEFRSHCGVVIRLAIKIVPEFAQYPPPYPFYSLLLTIHRVETSISAVIVNVSISPSSAWPGQSSLILCTQIAWSDLSGLSERV